MKDFDWTHIIRFNISILKSIGLWPNFEVYKFNWYAIYAFCFINIFVNGHNFFQTMNIFFVYNNLEALAATIFVSLSDVLASLKIYYFVKNMTILKSLIKQLNKKIFQPTTSSLEAIKLNLNIWFFTYFGFCVSAVLTLTLWSVFPILDKSVQFYRLPFAAWYPYNTKKSPNYEITYLYQVISIWVLSTANLNMDTLITALMMYTSSQCDILTIQVRNLNDNVRDFNKKLIKCVLHHKDILRYIVTNLKFFCVDS